MGKNDKKSGDKSAAKGKTAEKDARSSKSKRATSSYVITFSSLMGGGVVSPHHRDGELMGQRLDSYEKSWTELAKRPPRTQCEKHAKKEEALAKLRDGVKFDEVARTFISRTRRGKVGSIHCS
ncbi:hypothetical protein E4U09_007026 [Claviceps aff. purpurea]|uniref:Uncharacterized protein n=1 Tax=Claviceps aff. purpurea TaxID=1967640 RepID=A0A9P7QAH3_9HYPO|nr:hypothetical protein E4U09_007026 [Claviceps aff. purpurea]